MPGKRTLRQRVLTRPAAAPRPDPGRPPAFQPLPPLTPLFVYVRRPGPDGREWIEVGRGPQGATLGWIPAAEALDWPHTMTAVFQNPAGRPRTLFFEQRAPLVALLGGADPAAEATRLAEQAGRPPLPPGFPVTAMEPATHIDIRRQFYLLPILQAEQISFQDGREFRVMEVASLPTVQAAPPPAGDFVLDVAFVVDTTLSMGPYIERVRAALNRMVTSLAQANDRRARYALVGYRNSLEAQPRLDYLTRIFARFGDNLDPATFAQRAAAMEPTDVDSLSFNEDSFAAIRTSIQDLDWGRGHGRVIVLVTDAGSRDANDRFSATGLSPSQLGRIAQEAEVGIMVLHLRTPQGRGNHRLAEQQYVTLTSLPLPALGPHYFPVENGEPEAMNTVVAGLIRGFTAIAQDRMAAQGRPQGQQASPEDRAVLVGHAMRLAWLGRQERAAAPDIIRAWAADRYRQGEPPQNLDVRVLLTRNQLNTLGEALRSIIREYRENALDTAAMFNRLQQTAAALARDPDRLRQRGLEQLGDLLGEFLDGLPYRSNIANLSRDDWMQMDPGDRDELMNEMESRLRAYADFNATPELWWPPNPRDAREAGEQMFLVPLSLLP
jgi:serine/threonine-protein kinase PpkA